MLGNEPTSVLSSARSLFNTPYAKNIVVCTMCCVENKLFLIFCNWICPFPDESTDLYQLWCQSVHPFDSFPIHLNAWPHKKSEMPLGYCGRIVFSLCSFPDESADVHQIWCQSVQPCDGFPILLNLWPPDTPPRNAPWGIEGRLGFSLCPFTDESADVNQSWCQSVQPYDSFPRRLNVWPLNPPPPSAPLSLEGNLFGFYPFPDGSADVCQIWCQLVQPFDSFPRLLNWWHPNPPPEMPPGVLRGDLYLAYGPRLICRRERKLMPIGQLSPTF